MADFYVNAKTGNDKYDGRASSPSSNNKGPKKTVQAGINLLSSGKTLEIADGVYNERITIKGLKGTSSNPIVIQAAKNATPIIDGSGFSISNNAGLFSLTNSNHIHLEGLTIRKADTKDLANGIKTEGCDGIEVRNCTVYQCGASWLSFRNSDNCLAEDCVAYELALENEGGGVPGWPAMTTVAANCKNTTIQRCTIYNGWGEGIGVTKDAQNTIVRDNIVYNAWAVGIYYDSAQEGVIERNLVYYPDPSIDKTYWGKSQRDPGHGIGLRNEKPQIDKGFHAIRDVIVRNNFVVNCESGIFCNTNTIPIEDCEIVGNTVINPYRSCVNTNGESKNIVWKNNIFYKTNSTANGPIAKINTSKGHTFDYNCWYGSNPPSSGSGKNDVDANPKLVDAEVKVRAGKLNPDDYRLTSSSPCINEGQSLNVLKNDYWLHSRNGNPDIGAHELNGSGPDPVPSAEAKFSVTSGSTSGDIPLQVTFDASASTPADDIVSYAWDFGDGDVQTETKPTVTHVYDKEGTFSVSLTVKTDAGKQDTLTKNNLITTTAGGSGPIDPDPGEPEPEEPGERVTRGLRALYTFQEGSGNTIKDSANAGEPLNLKISKTNAVAWKDNGLQVTKSVLIQSNTKANKISTACRKSDALTIEAWITPANTTQDGPARIISMSQGINSRNFTLGQGGNPDTNPSDYFDLRIRTSKTDNNGRPSTETKSGTVKKSKMHVVCTRKSGGKIVVYIDGKEVTSNSITGNFDRWSDNYKLLLANESTSTRPWLGTFHLVAIYSEALSADEVKQNYEAGSEAETDPGTPEPGAGPIAEYTFNEGQGNIVRDVSGVLPSVDLKIQNTGNVKWGTGKLTVNKATRIQSASSAEKITNACKASNEITVEAWINPAKINQIGPARIVSISENMNLRNVTLGQGGSKEGTGDHYDVRLRTTQTDTNGRPSVETDAGSLTASLTHVVYTRDTSGTAKVYINGKSVKQGKVNGTFNNWNKSYKLILANEAGDDRPWLGEFRYVGIYDRALTASEVGERYSANRAWEKAIPTTLERFTLQLPNADAIGYGTVFPNGQIVVQWGDDDELAVYTSLDQIADSAEEAVLWLDR